MKRTERVAAILVVLGSFAGSAYGQGAPAKAAQAAKLAKLKAQRDAAVAAAKGTGGSPSTTTTPPANNTTILRPPPNPNPVVTNPTPTGAGGTTGAGGAAATTRTTGGGGAGGARATGAGGTGGTGGASATKTGSGGAGGAAAVLPPKDRTDTAAIALDLEALKKSRADRRHAEIVDLKQRFGNALLRNDRVLAELKQHAQRVAYLQRIRALSVKTNDAKLVNDVDQLLTKEELRSANAVNELRSGALPAVAATPPAAAPGGAK